MHTFQHNLGPFSISVHAPYRLCMPRLASKSLVLYFIEHFVKTYCHRYEDVKIFFSNICPCDYVIYLFISILGRVLRQDV